ncbi:spore germination protein [Cytobacillus massiliigabonensis]|uniref:spore germination protein n=1 Tax=Cytobacillus massiliigabonensis TaxID=1871011 RepID=UPI001F455FFE|nr:spore germination protein [Cytobacillus massiliigabonensis]
MKNLLRKRKNQSQTEPLDIQISLSNKIDENIEYFRSIYTNCSDVVIRPFLIGGIIPAYIIYIDGMANVEEADEQILHPLMNTTVENSTEIMNMLENKIPVTNIQKLPTLSKCVDSISTGNPLLLCDGISIGYSFCLAKWEKRGIEEPSAEVGIKGPREGFTETIGVSTSQLRRIIKSPSLKIQELTIGEFTKTKVVITYIEGLADSNLIEEVHNRLERIKIDGILESGYIEELIEDNPYSPFPQILSTERPDVVCSNLLEGRAAILVDGTPSVIVVPTTFFSLLQSHEDYYQRFLVSTAIRWLRYLFLLISLLLPSLYVAILTYHHEMVPTALLLSVAASREAVPFPALVEALMMEVTFEALREAGIRLPRQVGAAVSIVGALVIGQAAVQAGLVSAPMVIVVAITGIASFMIPRYAMGIGFRILRFPIIFLAGALGLLGVMMGIIAIVVHLSTIRSFGVPYLSPLAPLKKNELQDSLIRSPWWKLNTRPHLTGNYNKYRQSPGLKPDPNKGGE